MKTRLEQYQANEKHNAHGENSLLLAKWFGTEAEINLCERAISERDRLNGSGPLTDEAYQATKKYYPRLKKQAGAIVSIK